MSGFDDLTGIREIDEAPNLELEAFAKLSVTLGNLNDELAAQRRLRAQPSPAPVFFATARHVDMGATGIARVRFDGPPQGMFWYVRSIVVGGLDPTVVAAGAADVYVIAGAGSVSSASFIPSLMDWRDRANSLPTIAFYGRGELELRMAESLTIRFSGCTNGQTYACGMRCEQYQESAGPQNWER